MEDSATLYKQMQDLAKTYGSYAGGPTQSQIITDLNGRVDNFRPQYQELANQESKAYAMPATMMGDFYSKYSADPMAGPGQMSRLSSILRNIGSAYGNADVMRGTLDSSRGRLGDMAQDIFGEGQAQQQNILQQYQMKSPLYSAALGREEAEKSRAAATAAARSGGGGGRGGMGSFNPYGMPPQQMGNPGPRIIGYDKNGNPIYDNTLLQIPAGNAGANGFGAYAKDNFGKVFNTNITGSEAWRNRAQGSLGLTPAGMAINALNPSVIPNVTDYYQDNLGDIFNTNMSGDAWQDRAGAAFNVTPVGAAFNGIKSLFN